MKKNVTTTLVMVLVVLTIGLVTSNLLGLWLGYNHVIGQHEGKGFWHRVCTECPCLVHEGCHPMKGNSNE